LGLTFLQQSSSKFIGSHLARRQNAVRVRLEKAGTLSPCSPEYDFAAGAVLVQSKIYAFCGKKIRDNEKGPRLYKSVVRVFDAEGLHKVAEFAYKKSTQYYPSDVFGRSSTKQVYLAEMANYGHLQKIYSIDIDSPDYTMTLWKEGEYELPIFTLSPNGNIVMIEIRTEPEIASVFKPNGDLVKAMTLTDKVKGWPLFETKTGNYFVANCASVMEISSNGQNIIKSSSGNITFERFAWNRTCSRGMAVDEYDNVYYADWSEPIVMVVGSNLSSARVLDEPETNVFRREEDKPRYYEVSYDEESQTLVTLHYSSPGRDEKNSIATIYNVIRA